ncbi:MAG: LPS assembly protein LptD [Nitrospirota bacterium]
MKNGKLNRFIYAFLFFILYFSFISDYCRADEETVITSESLEYDQDTFTYRAKGDVKIQRGDTTIQADEIIYNEKTSGVTAQGSLRYEDAEVSITAKRGELNLEDKSGILYDVEILFKKDNYRITGQKIEKKGEKYYSSPEASFTTCDAPVPAWCFKGRNIEAVIDDELSARDVSFRIKNIPVLYTPYFHTPILNERKTGFLMPTFGYSRTRGWHINTPFFWAITENRDTTVSLDIYTKKGIGQSLEYRYVEPFDIEGNWYLYHIRDTDLKRDFFEGRAVHEQRRPDRIGGFLNLNIVNEKDFYREYSPYIEIRASRFLESTGEISLPLSNSRLYLLSQYWIDMRDETGLVPQRLPEIGHIVYPTKIGQFWFTAGTTFSNFWREEGIYGQRLDIHPSIMHHFGRGIIVLQTLGLKETAYSLHGGENDSPHSESLDYSFVIHTRLIKKFKSFLHVIEPSIGYTFLTDSEDFPLFDSTELFSRTSRIEVSLLNRFINRDGEFMVFRATQGFDSYKGDRSFLPLRLEVGIRQPLALRFVVGYNVHTGKFDSVNYDLRMNIFETILSAGQRYNRQNDTHFYTAGIGLYPLKPVYTEARIWYDAKEKVAKELAFNLRYLHQCWGVIMEFIKRPGDFTVGIMIELKGITKSLRM